MAEFAFIQFSRSLLLFWLGCVLKITSLYFSFFRRMLIFYFHSFSALLIQLFSQLSKRIQSKTETLFVCHQANIMKETNV